MQRVLVDKVESTQEQLGNVSRDMEILRNYQVHGDSCKAVPYVYFKFLMAIYTVNFLSLFSKKPRAVSFYANTSTSFLWSQEGDFTLVCLQSYIHNAVGQKTHKYCEVSCDI